MNYEILVPIWFLIPWLIFGFYVIRTTLYEMNVGLYEFGVFNVFELFKKIKELRKIDPYYDKLKARTFRWLIITAIWWAVSFFLLLLFALIMASTQS
jgi:hypothetical protein